MSGVTSTLSPGYLQVNPYYAENASLLRRQNRNSNEIQKTEKEKEPGENDFKLDDISSRKPDNELSAGDKATISELEKKEREVISHEAAHITAGGGYAGSPKYTRELGPDGKSYITGGEVSISVPPSNDPKEIIRRMEQLKEAALAPINPSSQDLNVAAIAANAEAQAAAQLASHQAEWGIKPEPARDNYEATDRIHPELPIVKKYKSSVHNDENSDITSTVALLREELLGERENKTDTKRPPEYKSPKATSELAPEENLYNMRLARKNYIMTSSPKGLWTISNGFEKISSSADLKIAQVFNIAA